VSSATSTAPRRTVQADPADVTGPRRTWSDRNLEADTEERRIGLPKLFAFVLAGWTCFGVLDFYIAFTAPPTTPRGWMVALRFLGMVPPLVGWAVTRKRQKVDRISLALEISMYIGLALCNSLRALLYGGLDSHLVNGISLLLIVQTMALPARWQRTAPVAAATYAIYPLVFAVASLFDPTVAAEWHSAALPGFVVDYAMVASCAIGGVIGGHIIWGMRRQLYYARRLGRYRLKARIGHGGMSEVWLAWDDALRRDVALKILDRTAASDTVAVRRFEREAMAASGLQSPHTIRVFDFGASDDGVWFMAMEHLEGVDLATLVEDVGPLPVPRALRFARQATSALSEAHDAGIVHRDVKPENLFVCRMGDDADFLKVLDFGIARIEGADEDATVTRAGWVHGTPAYMSPEVCNGARADARSDVYSLGAVLYYMLTGTPPFTAPTAAAVMVAHVNDAPEPPSARVPSVPVDVEHVVMRCLEKSPAQRYLSARELDEALAKCGDALASTGERAVVAAAVSKSMSSRPVPHSHPVLRSKEDVRSEEDAKTLARPSVRGGMKVR
jgi:eukaryotic-like serine/threonine-protein kinase